MAGQATGLLFSAGRTLRAHTSWSSAYTALNFSVLVRMVHSRSLFESKYSNSTFMCKIGQDTTRQKRGLKGEGEGRTARAITEEERKWERGRKGEEKHMMDRGIMRLKQLIAHTFQNKKP